MTQIWFDWIWLSSSYAPNYNPSSTQEETIWIIFTTRVWMRSLQRPLQYEILAINLLTIYHKITPIMLFYDCANICFSLGQNLNAQ